MQTFLPHESFFKSAACLDFRRLGKQRVEALQILNVLAGRSKGWRKHPAIRMWRGYETALAFYKDLCIEEWSRRGYQNTMTYGYPHISDCLPFTLSMGEDYCLASRAVKLPQWLGDEALHASHRSNLLRKDPDFYSQYKWREPPNLSYIWPI